MYSELFTKEIVFTEIFQKVVIQKFRKIHSVTEGVEITEIYSHSKSKNVTFTKFLSKKCDSEFP